MFRKLAKSAFLSVALAGCVGCALEAAPQAPQGTTTQEAIIPPMLPPKPLEAKPEGVQGKEAEKLEEAPAPHTPKPVKATTPTLTEWEAKQLAFIKAKKDELRELENKRAQPHAEAVEARTKAGYAAGQANQLARSGNNPQTEDWYKWNAESNKWTAVYQEKDKEVKALSGPITARKQDIFSAVKELKAKVGIVRTRELGIND